VELDRVPDVKGARNTNGLFFVVEALRAPTPPFLGALGSSALFKCPGGAWWSLVEPGGAWWSLVEPGGAWWSLVELDRVPDVKRSLRHKWLNLRCGIVRRLEP
jgi:hypothetical protein